MISTNELSFPMPAANLIAQRDQCALSIRRFMLMTALPNRSPWYVQTLWLLMPAGVFPPSH